MAYLSYKMIRIIFRAFFILSIIIAFITHFILLIIKVDRQAELSYLNICIPALYAYSGIILWAIYWFFINFLLYPNKAFVSMLYLALLFVSVGSMVSQVLLAQKFDYTIDISYWQALFPFMFFVFLGGIMFLLTSILKYFDKQRKKKF